MADDVIIISLCDARVHVQSSVNAYIALGQEYFLCLFHKEKAILDYRPAVRNVSSIVRPGPERREIKLRQNWRKQVDMCRPVSLKGAAHRGGGARRRGPERAVGHNGGALARAKRIEEQRAKLIWPRP